MTAALRDLLVETEEVATGPAITGKGISSNPKLVSKYLLASLKTFLKIWSFFNDPHTKQDKSKILL